MELAQDGGMGDGGIGLGLTERLQGYQPGQNLPDIGAGNNMMPDLGQDGMMGMAVPDNPGPAVAGRTPVFGSARRSRDLPVLRDQLMGAMS